MALTAEQFRMLQEAQRRSGQDTYYDPTTNQQLLAMRGANQSGGSIQNGEFVSDPISGYRMTEGMIPSGQDRTWLNGKTYGNYDISGNQTGSGMWQGLTPDGWKDDLTQIAKGAAALGLTAFGGSMLQGMGGAGSAGAAGSGLSEAGLAGEGAFGATNAAGGAAGGAGAGAGAGGVGYSFGITPSAAELATGMHIPGSALAAGAAGAGGAAGASGAAGAGGAGASGAAGGLSNLLGGNLGPLVAAGGALLGAQGNKNEQSSEHKMDPRLDGPVYGQNGVVPLTANFLTQAMDPNGSAMKGWQAMASQGQNMLSAPMTPNGFNRFYK